MRKKLPPPCLTQLLPICSSLTPLGVFLLAWLVFHVTHLAKCDGSMPNTKMQNMQNHTRPPPGALHVLDFGVHFVRCRLGVVDQCFPHRLSNSETQKCKNYRNAKAKNPTIAFLAVGMPSVMCIPYVACTPGPPCIMYTVWWLLVPPPNRH